MPRWAERFNALRRRLNPWLRTHLNVELCLIASREGRIIGAGVRERREPNAVHEGTLL